MAAGQGHPGAQANLGSAYYNGQGIARDVSKAAEWYRKAAEQGHARAQFSLGYMCEKGEGVPRDSAQATEWYRRAANQEYAPAVAALALIQRETSGDEDHTALPQTH
jgi:TPR repeat protein